MKPLLRRIRGAIGMALTWGAAWAVPGLVAGVPEWILVGMVSGAGFSIVLGLGESGSRFEELSAKRLAGWGALGAVLSAVLATPMFLVLSSGALEVGPFLIVVGLMGAASAAGTLAIARHAGNQDRLAAGETRAFLD